MIGLFEEKQLDRDYMEWRSKEIAAGRIEKPPAPHYNPNKFKVPFLSESNRATLGQPLQELEEELIQFKAARASGGSIDSSRLVRVHKEVERLRQQNLDIAWSAKQQSDYDKFVRGPGGTSKGNVGKSVTKRGGLWGKVLKNKKLIAGGAVAALAFGFVFSGRKDAYNTIPGMHPGSEGMGAQSIRSHSDFGSGYQGIPSSLMGQEIDPRILKFRTDVMDVPSERAGLEEELREAQKATHPGKLRKEDYGQKVQSAGAIFNPRNKKLQEVHLRNFNLTVEDADTLFLERKRGGGDPVQVRLSGVDAPETTGHTDDPLAAVRIDQAQPYGEKATDTLRDLIEQQDSLSLVIDPSQKTYGRYLGALVGDSSVLNLDLAKQGAVHALPFGSASKDIISRRAVQQAEKQAQYENKGLWQLARYKANAIAEENIRQSITQNTLTRIDKLSQNLNLGAFQSFLESFGNERRGLTPEEVDTASRMGYVLRKTHGPRKRAYNKFEGLHPGSEGIGAESIKKLTDFGSGFVSPFWNAYKQKASEEGWGYYSGYKSPETISAEKNINAFLSNKRNINDGKYNEIEGIHPGSEGMGAQSIRKHSEFRAKWDPVRKIAREIFKDSADDVAFKQLTQSKPFREAIATGMKSGGKKIGTGVQGEVWAYKAAISIPKKAGFVGPIQQKGFEFAVKRGRTKAGFTPMHATPQVATEASQINEGLRTVFKAEAGALEALGSDRAPSFYGHAKEFGLPEEAIIMEKFQLSTPLTTYKKEMIGSKEVEKLVREDPLNIKEVGELESFMKSAHKKGITHTDMHSENVVRAINPATGKKEVAVLDWGMANRFQEVKGIGGHQEHVMFGEGGKILKSQLQKAAGRPVGVHEFSEATDILRVRGHQVGTKAPRATKHAINAPYSYNETVRRIQNLDNELNMLKDDITSIRPHNQAVSSFGKFDFIPNATVAQIANLEKRLAPAPIAMAKKKELITDVADNVASYLSGGTSQKTSRLAESTGGLGVGIVVENKVRKKVKSDVVDAHAKTMIAEYNKSNISRSRSVKTVTENRARQAAIKRNKSFGESSQRSVGIGLRSSSSATKGHCGFHSTGSTKTR